MVSMTARGKESVTDKERWRRQRQRGKELLAEGSTLKDLDLGIAASALKMDLKISHDFALKIAHDFDVNSRRGLGISDIVSRERQRENSNLENSKKGRREERKKREFISFEKTHKIHTNLRITNRTRVRAVLCVNLKMLCSQKRTERTNRTYSHNAKRTTTPTQR